jgi:hypothetical protein
MFKGLYYKLLAELSGQPSCISTAISEEYEFPHIIYTHVYKNIKYEHRFKSSETRLHVNSQLVPMLRKSFSVSMYHFIRRHVQNASNLHSYHRENLKAVCHFRI